jgi:hypothetical protein
MTCHTHTNFFMVLENSGLNFKTLELVPALILFMTRFETIINFEIYIIWL